MKFSYALLTAAMVVSMTSASFAQKIKWQQGEDLAFMKGQTTIGTEYDYTKITVSDGGEQEYLASQKADLNADKAGDGDAFVDEWSAARTKKYQPQFEKGINKSLEKDGITVNNDGSAKYTIMLHTGNMEMGKGKMFVKKPAKVNYEFMIVETADKSKVVAKGTMDRVEGEIDAPKGSRWMGSVGTVMAVTANAQNRDYSNRIGKAYNNAGMAIGKAMHKAL